MERGSQGLSELQKFEKERRSERERRVSMGVEQSKEDEAASDLKYAMAICGFLEEGLNRGNTGTPYIVNAVKLPSENDTV